MNCTQGDGGTGVCLSSVSINTEELIKIEHVNVTCISDVAQTTLVACLYMVPVLNHSVRPNGGGQ